jgi:hypothetical protein
MTEPDDQLERDDQEPAAAIGQIWVSRPPMTEPPYDQ